MTSKLIFRSAWAEPYLTAAFAATRRYAAIGAPEEIGLLKQTIALCDVAVKLEPAYPLPAEAAPIRATVTRAVKQMRADFYVGDSEGSPEETIHDLKMWNALFHHASARLAALEGAAPA